MGSVTHYMETQKTDLCMSTMIKTLPCSFQFFMYIQLLYQLVCLQSHVHWIKERLYQKLL
jgi:hypothetical protein